MGIIELPDNAHEKGETTLEDKLVRWISRERIPIVTGNFGKNNQPLIASTAVAAQATVRCRIRTFFDWDKELFGTKQCRAFVGTATVRHKAGLLSTAVAAQATVGALGARHCGRRLDRGHRSCGRRVGNCEGTQGDHPLGAKTRWEIKHARAQTRAHTRTRALARRTKHYNYIIN